MFLGSGSHQDCMERCIRELGDGGGRLTKDDNIEKVALVLKEPRMSLFKD